MGKRPGTTAVARTDGDDVNLVTTSASGELPNHPEANGGRAYGGTKPTILNQPKEPRKRISTVPTAATPKSF